MGIPLLHEHWFHPFVENSQHIRAQSSLNKQKKYKYSVINGYISRQWCQQSIQNQNKIKKGKMGTTNENNQVMDSRWKVLEKENTYGLREDNTLDVADCVAVWYDHDKIVS